MRVALLALLALCGAEAVFGFSYVYTNSYTIATDRTKYLCGGTDNGPVAGQNKTLALCTDSVAPNAYYQNTSSQWFADTGCANTYQVTYDGLGCTGSVISASMTPTACGFNSFQTKQVCVVVNGTLDTIPAWPPAGLTAATNWLVNTTDNFADVANSAGPTPVANCDESKANLKSASAAAGGCKKRYSGASTTTWPASTQGFCVNGYGATATYTGANCDNLVSVSIANTLSKCTITNGATYSTPVRACTAGAPPSNPTQAITGGGSKVQAVVSTYNDNDCPTANLTNTLYSTPTCFDGATYTCTGTNNTNYVLTVSKSAGYEAGACNQGNPTIVTSNAGGQCINVVGNSVGSTQYKCVDVPVTADGGAASTISVSFVSFIVAAFVAMIASRQ